MLAIYARKTLAQRYIHEMIAQMKLRKNFSIPGQWLNLNGSFYFEFIGPAEDHEDSYRIAYS